jgi:hypothetical protein
VHASLNTRGAVIMHAARAVSLLSLKIRPLADVRNLLNYLWICTVSGVFIKFLFLFFQIKRNKVLFISEQKICRTNFLEQLEQVFLK